MMVAFLIVLAVILALILVILSLSATFTIVYDNGWTTKIKVLFIEKDIELSKVLSLLLFPDKKAKDGENQAPDEGVSQNVESTNAEQTSGVSNDTQSPAKKPAKPNPIKKLWDEEGVLGILSLASNLIETANSAILTLIRGLHIYSLYVMIIVGGGDAASIAQAYGSLCKYYYPVKGLILANMKVENYDDYIQPDFIAPSTQFEFQLIASINVGLLLKVALKAAFVFIKNLIKNKKNKGDY